MWHPDCFLTALGSSLAFGAVGILLMLAGFKLFDWITPGINVEHELAEKHNVAVAIVAAAVILGVCIVVASIVGA
jgi:putative membrane protein